MFKRINSNHIEVKTDENRLCTKRIKIALIIVTTITALLLSFIIFIWLCVTGGFPTKTSNINDYGTFKNFKGYSNLYIFPKEMSDSAKIESYYYYHRDTIFDATCQIYLEYSLPKEEFDAEVSRLSKISERYENTNYINADNKIVYDTNNFIYPAYVAIFNNNHCYEYALLNEEESKIICVFTQFIKPDDVKFDKKYLPLNFEDGKSDESFNIYYTYSKDGSGYFETHKR